MTWQNAMRGVNLGLPIPAAAGIPLFLTILHPSWGLLFFNIVMCIALAIMHARGRNLTWIFRRLQTKLAGDVMSARPTWYLRRMQRPDGFDLIDIDELKRPDGPNLGK